VRQWQQGFVHEPGNKEDAMLMNGDENWVADETLKCWLPVDGKIIITNTDKEIFCYTLVSSHSNLTLLWIIIIVDGRQSRTWRIKTSPIRTTT
jgi:hypothetical protein